MFDQIKDYLQRPVLTDLEVNYHAEKIWQQLADKNISASDIYHFQQSFGYDVACSLLYKAFKETPAFKQLSAFSEKNKDYYKASHRDILAVVLVHNPWESRKKNQDYQWRLKNIASDMGLDCVFPEIQYRRSIFPNAYYYQELLKRWSGRKVVFITHGLASLELRLVLEKSVQLPLRPVGWLNVSGLLFGTSLAPTDKDTFYRIKKYFNDEYPVLPEVARSQAFCYGPLRLSSPMPMVHMVALRPQRYYHFFESKRKQELNYWGPNDGYVTIADYLQKPGVTWPLWGQNHFIEVEMFKRRMQASIKWMLEQIPTEIERASHHNEVFGGNRSDESF